MHDSSFNKMTNFADKYCGPEKFRFGDRIKILDVGSMNVGNGDYHTIFCRPGWWYQGCDISPGNNVDFIMDKYHIPKADDYYDVVVSGQAMEHVEMFWLWTKELARVLKPGGLLAIIAPGGGPIHPSPLDCWRFNPHGMDTIIEWLGFEKLETSIDLSSDWKDCVLIASKPIK